ncbi:hypothetical protein ABIA52_000079 [Paenarthrobacter histidinolovorans]|uniref:Uncharacterized protein n=1 Tax=Paenarthrobacter histidinolovorans TaxID=43664 RepID=A0ABW8N3F7_9MICC
MVDKIRMTEADTVAPDASPAEDVLELRLLTAGPVTGPVDRAHGRPPVRRTVSTAALTRPYKFLLQRK